MRRYKREVVPLALAAAENALVNAQIEAQAIRQLVTVSCTGFSAPGYDLAILQELGLSPSTGRTHIGFMGCHGSLNALRVGRAFCAASEAPVLICAAEICSLHFQYGWDANHILANSLFSDGAAALVLSNGPSSKHWQLVDSRSWVVPDSAEVMTWTIGDNGFLMTLSSRIVDLLHLYLNLHIIEWLKTHDLTLDQINSWVIHPGGPRILDAVQDTLMISDEAMSASRAVFAECGNMSSPTVLFILDRILKTKQKPPCLILAFGPGLTIEAALLR
jgi:predicted naringenin-chalcone synthase